MAIKIGDEYAESNPPDANYPGGSFKNVSTPGGTDGTPFEKAWPNDIQGFLQRLLSEANIIPSGNPDTVLASDYYDAFEEINKRLAGSPRGYISGFILSPGIDSSHDIDLTEGAAGLTDGSQNYRIFFSTSPPTKRIDANWAEGDNSGGFPSGLTLSANTHYNYFLIGKNDGTLDAGFDTDSEAVNLLSDATGYIWYRRILSVFTNSSANIRQFLQINNYVTYIIPIVDIDDVVTVQPAPVLETGVLSVPPNQISRVTVEGDYGISTAMQIIAKPTAVTESSTISHFVGSAFFTSESSSTNRVNQVQVEILVDSNSEIEYGMDGTGPTNGTIIFDTLGWIDDRGVN